MSDNRSLRPDLNERLADGGGASESVDTVVAGLAIAAAKLVAGTPSSTRRDAVVRCRS